MSELIRERIDSAKDKDQLEAIGRELEPAVELDRRKNMDVLRAELHAHLDEHGDQGVPGDDTQDPEAADAQGDNQQNSDTQGSAQTEQTQAAGTGVRRKRYNGRLLQNMNTGVFFPWTAALAKKRNMREV